MKKLIAIEIDVEGKLCGPACQYWTILHAPIDRLVWCEKFRDAVIDRLRLQQCLDAEKRMSEAKDGPC